MIRSLIGMLCGLAATGSQVLAQDRERSGQMVKKYNVPRQ